MNRMFLKIEIIGVIISFILSIADHNHLRSVESQKQRLLGKAEENLHLQFAFQNIPFQLNWAQLSEHILFWSMFYIAF